MKKINCFIATLVGILSVNLIGCSAKLPSTQFEKVKFAFNGVEKSFKSPKASKKSLLRQKRNKIGGSNPSSALDTIFALYKEEDKRDDFLEDVSYNQPPMVQFQYVKKVLEKIGSGYEFDKKYYDTVRGDIYVDINTGFKKEGDQYKYNYTFVLGMSINIDNNDLITADVSFDINLKKGSESYTTKWYVGIELDYDMANSSPNYTMTMVTENDERELPYYNHYTYEYDYVEVRNSAINEWRKFCMDNDHRLVKDSTHQSFNAYIDEGSKYNVDACSWYKNGTYYKNKNVRQNSDSTKVVAEALFAGLGLNANEINADVFFNKDGEENSVIKTSYNDFSKIRKEDIIYDLVCRDEDDHNQQQQQQIAAIRAMNSDLSGGAGNYKVRSTTTIRQLLSSFDDDYGERVNVHLYYVDQNGGLISEITDLVSLRYFIEVRSNNYDFSHEVSLDDNLYNIMERYKFTSRYLSIGFVNQDDNVAGMMDFEYAGDLPDTYVKPTFPQALSNLGIPEYDGNRIEFTTQSLSKEPYVLEISNTTYDESQAYRTKLTNAGFTYDGAYMGTYKGSYYRIDKGDKYLYVNYFDGDVSTGVVTIRVFHEDKPVEIPPEDTIKSITMVGDFNGWDLTTGGLVFSQYEDYYQLNDVLVEPHQAFKFVVNNEWGERGGYGYSDFTNLPEYNQFLSGGEHNNVVVFDKTLVLTIRATVNNNSNIFFTIVKLDVRQPK